MVGRKRRSMQAVVKEVNRAGARRYIEEYAEALAGAFVVKLDGERFSDMKRYRALLAGLVKAVVERLKLEEIQPILEGASATLGDVIWRGRSEITSIWGEFFDEYRMLDLCPLGRVPQFLAYLALCHEAWRKIRMRLNFEVRPRGAPRYF